MGERWKSVLWGSVGLIGLLAAGPTLAGDRAAGTGPLVAPPICSGRDAALPLGSDKCKRVEHEPGSIALTVDAKQATMTNIGGRREGAGLTGGYSVNTTTYNGVYHPPVMEVDAGNTIYFQLNNLLPAVANPPSAATNHTNLHTHGLIVAPRPLGSPAGLGDNIFVDLAPGMDPAQSATYRINIPKVIPKAVFDPNSKENVAYPTGLNWYHPHIHGVTSAQVGSGMAGLISIGAPKDQIVVEGPGGLPDPVATKALRDATDVEYMILRDMPLQSTVMPEDANGETATIVGKPTCVTPTGQTYSPGGYCAPADTGTGAKQFWLFTINGQRYPNLNVPAGRNKLWRFANMSSNQTYVLQLLDKNGNAQEMEVLTVDGVTAGKPNGTGHRVQALKLTELMVMPAARTEILVRNDGSSKYTSDDLVLVTKAVANLTGPAVGLAAVSIEKPAVAQAPGPKLSVQKPWVMASSQATPVASAAARTSKADGHGSHGSHATHSTTAEKAAPAMGGSSTANASTQGVGPCFERPKYGIGLGKGERRQIQFGFDVANKNNFGLGASIMKGDKVVKAQMPITAFDPSIQHVCSPFGASEVWELVNTTNFPHNFHMHQVKFRLARADELKAIGVKSGPIVDPQGTMNGLYLPEDGGGVDVWHDTLPLPPASEDEKTYGRAFVVINFNAVEQIGTYVYHCHILGHEDKGMMSVMEVVNELKVKVAQK
ncbi:MAG TPA: multicopper oxidase domain-containing protein [Azospirillum sp.]|nr:multicopper oxidase domain-containing protein [Azospirillum sp.]